MIPITFWKRQTIESKDQGFQEFGGSVDWMEHSGFLEAVKVFCMIL